MGNENFSGIRIYGQKKLKWYEKIWYFITGKKNQWVEITEFKDISTKGGE